MLVIGTNHTKNDPSMYRYGDPTDPSLYRYDDPTDPLIYRNGDPTDPPLYRYGDPTDPSLVLLFDDHGYIAGVQSGLREHVI